MTREPPAKIPVVILAAGRGHRLSPRTDDLPKCLLPVGSTSPLSSALSALTTTGSVSRVSIVTGHRSERIDEYLDGSDFPFPVDVVFNDRFDTANNIVSLAVARDRVEGLESGFLLVNSDVFAPVSVFAIAISAPAGSGLVIDPTKPIRDEAMKTVYEEGRLSRIGKDIDPRQADGEYIGIARFDESGTQCLFAMISEILAEGGDGEWYEAAIGRAARLIRVHRLEIEGLPWVEIDDFEDLARATREVLPAVLAGC